MPRQKILVLCGGRSAEREVSLRSGESVIAALIELDYEVDSYDPLDGYDYLDGLDNSTIIFPILHGSGGEDGEVQLQLERRGLKYLGSDSRSSANCFDKQITREILQKNNIRVPVGGLVIREEYAKHNLYHKPHVLKIVDGGSSIGTLVVKNPSEVDQLKVKEIFNMSNRVIIEEMIAGREITVPILGFKALPVIEIIAPEDGGFDYQNKYNGQTKELCPAENISKVDQAKAQEIAENVHRVMKCSHISRTDMIIKNNSEILVLEINTIPGMTSQSLYPKSARVAGYDMSQLMEKFIELIGVK